MPAGDRFVGDARVHVPARRPARPPLVLAFHGLGDNPVRWAGWSGLSELADRRGFVVAYPGPSSGRRWQLHRRAGNADVRRTRELIDRLHSRACIDASRVYVTGFSNGAGFAARAACELADRVAAVVPVAGSYKAIDPCPAQGPEVAVMEVHGTKDPWFGTVPRLLAMWRSRNHCGARGRTSRPRAGVARTTWAGCDVVRVRLARTRHVWPGTSPEVFDPTGYRAPQEAWAFMARHRRCGRRLCAGDGGETTPSAEP